jgi:CBS domain-containing protein
MKAKGKPLAALTAADVMTRDLVVIGEAMTLQDAAHLLAGNAISGAPVVDAQGRCVGVLSATDFFRWMEDERLEISPAYEVDTLMAPDPVTVPPSTPMRDLARMMVDGHIHRIIVVDERRRPVGIVSSTDILAVMASVPGEKTQ